MCMKWTYAHAQYHRRNNRRTSYYIFLLSLKHPLPQSLAILISRVTFKRWLHVSAVVIQCLMCTHCVLEEEEMRQLKGRLLTGTGYGSGEMKLSLGESGMFGGISLPMQRCLD
jgi:hypothetical protein